MSTMETLVVTHDATTLDLLLWRRLLRAPDGLVERTLELNPGLASVGTILPVGAQVLVEIPDNKSSDHVVVVTLWD